MNRDILQQPISFLLAPANLHSFAKFDQRQFGEEEN